ncbi:tripartite tricarboxylate transporter substrate binding protein [Bradyrhizobium sp. 190]|uniref:Bug family tripartite tricarboxylate transporter substrate binding protein n=1 Tax=Bradyrhizobium sp. 190 TaxID=2782658 RepID=UPI001FF82F01|nr:tripartite tricarboxylate transporter substrate binding protein [Bradyrhizobium sp. 190]MCK1513210.1 tripartite tricarboxylate transporter substrate binding protein [Bradyrhizobium sp. 190]
MDKYSRNGRRGAMNLMALVLCAMTFVPTPASAQNKDAYPTRLITLVVPSEAGGAVDITARSLAQHLSKTLGKSVIVENRSGASGAIGATYVARSAPDGYTLLVGPGTVMVVNPMVSKTQYDATRDFRAAGLLVSAELVFVTSPATGFKTLDDVIQYAKKNPGKLTYASNGPGSSFHLATELLLNMVGIDLLHVPYRGGASTATAMLAGDIGIMLANTAYVLPYIRSGSMVALAIASPGQSSELPDVPAASKTVPGYEANTWIGLYAPAGTSDEVIAKLNAEMNTYLRDPKGAAEMRAKGLEPLSGSPEDAVRFQSQEQEKWGRVVSLVRAKGQLN